MALIKVGWPKQSSTERSRRARENEVTGDMYRAGEILDQKIRRLTRENDAKERELEALDQESEEEEHVYTSSYPGSHVARMQMAGGNPNSPYYRLPPESITWDRSAPNLKYM